jgi:hypothetical protein
VLEWVEHKGQRVLIGRFTGLTDEESLKLIDEAQGEILKHRREPHSVLFLTSGATSLNETLTRRWREFATATEGIVKATAVEGLTFFVRAVAKLMKPSMYFAKNEQDALDWLIKQ